MSRRIEQGWTVLASPETEDGLRCVDLFRRIDGTFGYEEFRRDPEELAGQLCIGAVEHCLEVGAQRAGPPAKQRADRPRQPRSEERRVGKEC